MTTSVSLTVRSFDYLSNLSVFRRCDSMAFDGFLITLNFVNIQNGCLGFETELEDLLIPYDKLSEWSADCEGGKTYCRVNPNGKIVVKHVDPFSEGLVLLSDVLNAHKNGDLVTYLQDKLERAFVIGWDEQNTICENRALTKAYLMYSANINVYEITQSWSEGSEVIPTSTEHLSFDDKVRYLLDSGYLAPSLNTPKLPPEYLTC